MNEWKSVIGTPGYLSEEQAAMADMEADEAMGWKPSKKIILRDVEACVKAGIPRERAEKLMGLTPKEPEEGPHQAEGQGAPGGHLEEQLPTGAPLAGSSAPHPPERGYRHMLTEVDLMNEMMEGVDDTPIRYDTMMRVIRRKGWSLERAAKAYGLPVPTAEEVEAYNRGKKD